MYIKTLLLIACGVISVNVLQAQLLVADPPFPSAGNQVTIYFDATQGTGGLANCNCSVYLHTGVITNASSGTSDWKHVVTTWGVANSAWQMQPVPGQPNMYSYVIGPSINQYYGIQPGEVVQKMAFVFRNANGTLEGKATGGADIFYDVYPDNIELTTALQSPTENNFSVALGQTIPVSGSASTPATLKLYDNGALLKEESNATQLEFDIIPTASGVHNVAFIAETATDSDTSHFTYSASLQTTFLQPNAPVLLVSVSDNIPVHATSYISCDIALYDNGNLISQTTGTEITANINVADGNTHEVTFLADYNGETSSTSFVYLVPGSQVLENPPAGSKDGITYLTDSSIRLQLYAPNKQVVHVLGDFNNWLPGIAYQMNKSIDGNTFWLEITGLTPGQPYSFQYLVDGELKVADPYSTVVLDPYNDPYIPEATYPNLPPYPTGKTTGIVSLIQPGAPSYNWQVTNFTPQSKEKLVVYELLLRDFLDRHDFTTLIDTLDYLDRLGITAIELMPVSEFEGNISWGYNPSFHMALDKYYGTINEMKRFVDACHTRGIAVILDVVYNHTFSQSPLAQLYWDPAQFRPRPDNPWLNPVARHPFNVGYDFNHESPATRKYIDQVMTYWLSEMRVDGFRFDLSKGFTQTFNTDVNAWGAYDASRIAILKHYADVVWGVNSNAFVILEHFAANTEETELNNYGNGMMLWGGAGIQNQYLEAALGYSSNLSGASYKSRGWTQPNLLAYMESHDEERMMYKNLQYGNASGNYNIKNILTGFKRVELASAFYYTIPGPKMLWEFGELGYEYSINYCPNGTINDNCRVDPKPIRWDFYQSPNRRRIYNVVSALIDLKKTYPVFSTTNFTIDVQTYTKKIQLLDASMDAVVAGNFNVVTGNVSQPFPHTGMWYEYFTGDSLQITDPNASLPLAPGEYRIYTTSRLNPPPGGYITGNYEPVTGVFNLNVAPNPSVTRPQISYTLTESSRVQVELFDLSGQKLATLADDRQALGPHTLTVEQNLAPGLYLVRLVANGKMETVRMVVLK